MYLYTFNYATFLTATSMSTTMVQSVTVGRGTAGLRRFLLSQVFPMQLSLFLNLPPLSFFLRQETIEVESEHVFKLAALALQVSARHNGNPRTRSGHLKADVHGTVRSRCCSTPCASLSLIQPTCEPHWLYVQQINDMVLGRACRIRRGVALVCV